MTAENTDWEPVNERTPLRAGVSGFGFGGVNAHVIVESYAPAPVKGRKRTEDSHVFALSALNENSLNKQIGAWKLLVDSSAFTYESIGDMSKTLLAGRRHCADYRIGAVIRSKEDLKSFLALAPDPADAGAEKRRDGWELYLTNILYRGYSDIRQLLKQEYISQHFESVLSEIEAAASEYSPRSGIRIARWKKERAAAYSFIVNYAMARALIGLGVRISEIGGEHQGELLALAVSGMLSPAEAYTALIDETAVDGWSLQRPELAFADSITPVKICRLNINAAYPASLRELRIEGEDSRSLRHFTEKARILSRTQYTFKKYLKDWDQALQPWKLTAEALLNDEELLTGNNPLLEKQRVLLLMIAYGSLLKLNRKWELTDRIGLESDWLKELIQLVVDEVLTRESAAALFLSEDGDLEEIGAQINRRQDLLDASAPFEHLYAASSHLAEIPELAGWKDQLKQQLRELPSLQTEAVSLRQAGIQHASFSLASGLSGLNELLLKLWAAGADISWQLLYPAGSYRKQQLPGYCFERSSHWIPLREPGVETPGGNINGNPAAATRKFHPMLDLDKSSPETGLFVKTLKISDFYVGDHIVDNRVILPGVAYLEIARAAGELAAGQPVQALRDVMWVNRMEIEDLLDAYVQIQNEADFMRFQVFTWRGGEKIRHCQGKLSISEKGRVKPVRFNIPEIKGRCGARISKDFCYKEVFGRFIGFQYGPGFQATQEAFGGDGESLEKLELPAHLLGTFDEYDLHPSLVDAALRAVTWIGGAEAYRQLQLHIPFALGELSIYGKLTPNCYSYARIEPETAGKAAGMQRFHIFILSEAGEVLVEARDFTIRAIQPKTAAADNVHLYTESWLEATLPESGRNEAVHVLYFGKNRMSGQRLAEALGNGQGKAVEQLVFVQQGPAYSAESDGEEYTLNPAQQEDFLRMFQELADQGLRIDSIVFEWDEPRIIEAFCAIYFLFQAFVQVNPKQPVRLVYASSGDGAGAGMFKGLCKAFQTLSRTFLPSILHADDANELPLLAAKELLGGKTASCEVVSYREGVRTIRAIAALDMLLLPSRESSGFRSGGTYLITGGMGKLGLAVAEFVLVNYKANIVLTGRSALDKQRQEQLSRLESLPGQVIYVAGDLSALSSAEEIVKQAKEAFGTINGVIHCAGVLGSKTLAEAVPGELTEVLLPKIHGAIGLDEATRNEQLDFFILFSSISALIGDFARGTYAAANSFLDHFAERRAEQVKAGLRSGISLSINWPVWNEGAMQLSPQEDVQYRQHAGMDQLETHAGLELLERLTGSDLTRVIVACGNARMINRVLDVKERVQTREGARSLTIDTLKQSPSGGPIPTVLIEQEIVKYLKGIVSKATGIPPGQLQRDAEFSKYGIDSIMIMDLNSMLEGDFSDLPSTLFFEYSTIGQLTAFFLDTYAEFFRQKVQSEESRVPHKLPEPELPKEVQILPETRQGVAEVQGGDIAIIGLSGQYPMADTLEQFWEILRLGKDCVTEIPAERWDYHKDYNPEKGKSNKVYTKWGAFMNNVEKFDAGFFHISPREAELMDPQERLMLQSAYHTLEDAGYAGGKVSGKKVGVFVGVMNSHYQMLGAEQYAKGKLQDVRSSFASIANRISYYFNFKGPSLAVDTMCSSALVAIHMACESIRRGESELAMAGSVNTIVHPAKYIFLSDQRFGSSEGKCRAFGQGGDGYVPGEGVGAVLLKPLEAAQRDGDRIYGVIKGSAVNHGGKVSSYTVPNPNAQAELIEEALRKSGVHPERINYIEAHGTGTALGDPIEIAGLTKAFRKSTEKTGFCAIGSVKSNIGHLESAAGMASLTKVLLQMRHKQLAPSILADTLNSNIDFEKTPFFVQRELRQWEQLEEETPSGTQYLPLTAGISSFGAGGTNAHLIIESYEPDISAAVTDSQSLPDREQLILLSAKTPDKLKEQAGMLAEFIGRHRAGGQPVAVAASEAAAAQEESIAEPGDVYGRCVEIIAEVLGVNPELIDWDEDLATLSADAVHRVAIAAQLREIFQGEYDEEAFWNSRSLRELMNRYAEAGQKQRKQPQADAGEGNYTLRLEDIAYTLQTGREMFDERTAFVCRTAGELRQALSRFAAGESNMPDVYTGGPGMQGEMTSILFHNDPGNQFIERIVSSRNLPQIAQLWLLKVDIPWKQLHEGSSPQLITLPNYSFNKKRYWIGKGFTPQASAQYETASAPSEPEPEYIPVRLEAVIDKLPDSAVLGAVLLQDSAEAEDDNAGQGIEQCLYQVLGEVIYAEAGGIDGSIPFSELGVNSVLTLELVDKVNEKLGIALHSNDVFNFNTVQMLAEHILMTYPVKPGLESHREDIKGLAAALRPDMKANTPGRPSINAGTIDLNALELLLEES